MNEPRLLQLSGAVIDLIYEVEALPLPGEEAQVLASSLSAGGGYNAMIAARRAGMQVAYAGAHGTGPFAQLLREALAQEAIEILLPASAFADQGLCTVLVDAAGERTFITRDGAERTLDAEALAAVRPSSSDWLLLSGYGLAMSLAQAALEAWLQSLSGDACFVFDPSPRVAHIPPALLALAVSRAYWVSANRREAQVITGLAQPERAVLDLAAGAKGRQALVRCGEEGCWLAIAGAQPLYVPAYAVAAVDTNGAGDTHIGSFIAALAAGVAPPAAAAFANACAALSTTRPGPATAPSAEEACAFMANSPVKDPDQPLRASRA